MMAKYSDLKKDALIETDRYIYHNPVIRWLNFVLCGRCVKKG